MPVKVRCPECETAITAPDQARGKAMKCPECGGRVRVPAGNAQRAGGAGQPKKRRPEADDGGDFLSDIDLARAEDKRTRVCPKCGTVAGEDDVECSKCGVDLETGRLSAKRKALKARGGPNPDKYYQTAVSESWGFMLKNKSIAIRTMVYHLICAALAIGCLFMCLWVAKAPLKVFWLLLVVVFAPIVPGWAWLVHTEVIKFTTDRKSKVWKHPKFDLFASTALGLKMFFWLLAFGLPFWIAPGIIGAMQISDGNASMGLLIIFLGFLPVIPFFPIAMSHFAMPVEWPGWAVWKIVPIFFKGLAKPCLHWTAFLLMSMLPSIGLIAAALFAFQPDVRDFVYEIEMNARKDFLEGWKEPKATPGEESKMMNVGYATVSPWKFWFDSNEAEIATMKKDLASRSEDEKQIKPLPWEKVLPPVILLLCGVLCFGFPALFNMRTNGWITYYFHPELELIAQAKEVTYVSKRKPDDDLIIK